MHFLDRVFEARSQAVVVSAVSGLQLGGREAFQ